MAGELAKELNFLLASDDIPNSIPFDETNEQAVIRRKRLPTSVVDEHPMRAAIIAALLAGEGFLSISKWIHPRLNPYTIRRYFYGWVKPALMRAHNRSSVDHLKDPAGYALNLVAQGTLQDEPITAARRMRTERIQDRINRLDSIIEERGQSMADEVEGGSSGLLLRDVKSNQTVYRLDKALLSELRAHEERISQELGQERERIGTAVMIVVPQGTAIPTAKHAVIDIGLKEP